MNNILNKTLKFVTTSSFTKRYTGHEAYFHVEVLLPIPKYTLSIITSQLHRFQLRTTLNGKDFKFFSHGLCTEKQNILLQHMHKKEFFILTNKCISIIYLMDFLIISSTGSGK
jgi:hypothetical protein